MAVLKDTMGICQCNNRRVLYKLRNASISFHYVSMGSQENYFHFCAYILSHGFPCCTFCYFSEWNRAMVSHTKWMRLLHGVPKSWSQTTKECLVGNISTCVYKAGYKSQRKRTQFYSQQGYIIWHNYDFFLLFCFVLCFAISK